MARAGSLWRYVPFDVDGGMVRDTAARSTAEYPGLEVVGVTGDFEHDLDEIPPPEPGHPRIVAFLGGTIGNFIPGSRRRFLRELAARLDERSFLLLGTDLVKDPAVLEAAYNDSQGVTAEFNLNILRVLNRELDADFDLEQFEHVAFYDEQREWIEMRLRARRAAERARGGDRPRPRVRAAARSCGPRSPPSSRPSACGPTSAPPVSSSCAG